MNKIMRLVLFIGICFLGTACGAGLVVDSSGDLPDLNQTDGKCETANGDCTLRAAIMEANVSPDISEITFKNITLIEPVSPLPDLIGGNTSIDGNGIVTLSGSQLSGDYDGGLVIRGARYTIIQGLTITNFKNGIYVDGRLQEASDNVIGVDNPGQTDGTEGNVIVNNQKNGIVFIGEYATDNHVRGNFIGTDQSSAVAMPNGYAGILITDHAHQNWIGSFEGTGISAGGNLISGNVGPGIEVSGSVQRTRIMGNYIGIQLDGETALGNYAGVRILNSGIGWIGYNPYDFFAGNIISGNTGPGVELVGANNIHIGGNYIGTNASGTAAVPNSYGVLIREASYKNFIGRRDSNSDVDQSNLISGNLYDGVNIADLNTTDILITDNLIGVNYDGSAAIGNGGAGVTVNGNENKIGDRSDQGFHNVISGNGTSGILLNASNCLVSGNLIGTDITGTIPIGNMMNGITINPTASDNIIGTNGNGNNDIAERNIISGNDASEGGFAGIEIRGNNNTIAGNYIGTDITGSTSLANLQDGIVIKYGASGNRIGTDANGLADEVEGNLISGNGHHGIWILDAEFTHVAGNMIGTNASGSAAVPNGWNSIGFSAGVYISDGSSNNVVGTDSYGYYPAAEGNLISGNASIGVSIRGDDTQNNDIAGNYIGTDLSGSSAIGNQTGVEISEGAHNNHIGTNGDGSSDMTERNVISGNSGPGIFLMGSHNLIAGNYIGTDASGSADLGNGTFGISINDGSTDNLIGGSSEKSNTIAFNGKDGIAIIGSDSNKNLISMNSIYSNDETGIDLAPANDPSWFTPNDPGDADLGPNQLMNFPQLDKASSIMTSAAITGQILDGLPNTLFRIEFFNNPACDSPGDHGEGKVYLGYMTEQTDANGNSLFQVVLPGFVAPGSFITATATTNNTTSEFSACVEVAESQTYMEKADEEEDFPCDEFMRDQMEITSSFVATDTGFFTLYIKNPGPYPIPGPDANWGYTALLGEIPAVDCYFQGFDDRVYCSFIIPEPLYNTAQPLRLFSSLCEPPIYTHDRVSILTREPTAPDSPDEPEGCHSGLSQRACIAAGGTYSYASDTCICPRR